MYFIIFFNKYQKTSMRYFERISLSLRHFYSESSERKIKNAVKYVIIYYND